MEIILLGIYAFFAWLVFFKFKWLPWNFTSQVITITLPIVGLMVLFLLLNIAAPATNDVRAMNYVIPIVPRITGQVTEVPIQPNRPIKKGDVLFKIDPVPFEAAVKAAEATLRGLEDQLKNATAKKAALTPRIDLAKKRVEQFTALAATGAGKRADLEQAQSDLGNLQSEFLAADATESQYGQACHAAKVWMDGQQTDPKTLVEPYLKLIQAPDFTGAGNFNTPWANLTPAQQAGVIMAVNGAANGECE